MNIRKAQNRSQRSLVRGDVAIIGMACEFPGASDLDTYWQNIVSKVDAITDVPSGRWNTEIFYDPDPRAEGRVYCKRGGYLDFVSFNPLKYGTMPVAVEGGEPDQFLTLRVVHDAMQDAGYLDRPMDGERTEFVLGRGNYLGAGIGNVIQRGAVTEQTIEILKALHPEYTPEELDTIRKELRGKLPSFSSETAPAIIPNLSTGRVANRLGFMGYNFTVDAACASSLIAVEVCVRDLLTGKCDLALAGGVHVFTDIPFLMVFCALQALSPTSQIRPFDRNADGTMPGEGMGIVVLKRLEEAEQDGDRIYAVIKGVGTSSDGRAVSVMAPRVEGEELALRRAYEMADISPRTVELIEAHGTGTPAGDAAEIEALTRVFGSRDGSLPWCALGTVKSMIGHAMPAAGMAGLIKAALSLYHKVLPPTLHCEDPHPRLQNEKVPFYVNTETRPWIHEPQKFPRRAGVNAFGFGGTNAHVIMEEYVRDLEADVGHRESGALGIKEEESEIQSSRLLHWETEVCIFRGTSRDDLIEHVRRIQRYLNEAPRISLKDLAYTLNTGFDEVSSYQLGIVASSLQDLQKKMVYALRRLSEPGCTQIKDRQGIYFFERPFKREGGKLAFLFTGEGSQYVNMLADLCIHFPEVRACFDIADGAVHERSYVPPSRDIFPPPSFSEAERKEAEQRLWQIERATEAVLTADGALFTLLNRLGIQPDLMLGHSAGEWSAMAASGILDIDEFIHSLGRLNAIYRALSEDRTIPKATMVAVGTDRDVVASIAAQVDGEIYIANDNCPHQVVIAGEEEAIEQTLRHLRDRGIFFEKLPYKRGYHTPVFTYICDPLREYFSSLNISSPKIPVYSCSTAAPFPDDPEEILELAAQTFARPLEFRGSIEAMYKMGTRIFVEVGPKGNLTAFVDDILRGQPHLAVASNVARRPGITQLNHLIGLLAAQGVSMRLDYLYARRNPCRLSLGASADGEADLEEKGAIKMPLGFPPMYLSPRDLSVTKRAEVPPALKASTGRTNGLAEPHSSTAPRTPEAFSTPKASTGRTDTSSGSRLSPPLRNAPQPEISSSIASSSSMVCPEMGPQAVPVAKRAGAADAMAEYLQTMEHFLEIQQEVMQAYLSGGQGIGGRQKTKSVSSGVEKDREKPVVSSIRSAETVLTDLEPFVPPPPPPPESVSVLSEEALSTGEVPSSEEVLSSEEGDRPSRALPVEMDLDTLTQSLLDLVSEKTGYPPDMLDLNLDMEADLGIDSIKRIEILGAFQEQYGLSDQNVDMEEVASLRTLKQVTELLGAHLGDNGKLLAMPSAISPEEHKPLGGSNERERQPEHRGDERIPWSGTDTPSSPPFPLIGTVTSLVPGKELVAIRQMDLSEDRFLEDHRFGRDVSDTDPTLRPLPVVPMTMSIEMMAEAAALLMPGMSLVGVKDIRAYRWIQVEEWGGNSVMLQITARRRASASPEGSDPSGRTEEIEVHIHNLTEKADSPSSQSSPIIQGKFIFAPSPLEPPLVEGDFVLRGGRPSKIVEDLYEDRFMFHGLAFRGVISVDEIGEDGVRAQLEVLPTDRLFRSTSTPLFVIDPALLDAAGQLVGYWPIENLDTAFIVFPIGIRSLYLYGPNLRPSERVTCRVRIRQVTSRQIRADMDVIRPDGRLWMRVMGWTDWRFYWPAEFHYFWRFPNKGMVSLPVSLPLADTSPVECCRVGGFTEFATTIWENVWAHLMLTRKEREAYWGMKPDTRRSEWLLGRTAAKDAVRIWLKKHYGLEVYPADIQIRQDMHGRPMPEGVWLKEIEAPPILSLAHAEGLAIAAAGAPDTQRLGVDLEPIRPREQGFETVAFSEEERSMLDSLEESGRAEWVHRLWCAKEAVFKALGEGPEGGPQGLAVRNLDVETGSVYVALGETLSDAFPEYRETELIVHTMQQEDYIIAVTLCERREDG